MNTTRNPHSSHRQLSVEHSHTAIRLAFFVVSLCVLCMAVAGCRHGYVPSEEPPGVKHPEMANLSDFNLAAAQVIRMMLGDSDFRESYNALKNGKCERPVLMVGPMTLGSKTSNERMLSYLNAFRARMRADLRKSQLFTIVDDAASPESASPTIVDSISTNAAVGLKSNALLQVFGKHTEADYYLLGTYREFEAEGRYSYIFEMTLWNLHTGEADWNDSADIEKE